MLVRILKRPSNHVSSDVHNTSINGCVKNVNVETSSKKTSSPMTVSSSLFIATSDGTIFKPKQLPKPNVDSSTTNKGKYAQGTVSPKPSKGLK